MKNSVTSLTAEERKILKNEIKRSYITGMITGLMISFIFTLMMLTKFEITKILYLSLVIITGTIFLTSIAVRNLYRDLRINLKNFNEYLITEKLSYIDDEPGLGGVHIKYFLISYEKKISVTEEMYNIVEVNDRIIEHESPNSKICFRIEVLNYR